MELAYQLIDAHVHLEDDAYAADVADVVARARAAGVAYMFIPATNAAGAGRALDIARRHAGVYFAAGLHPNDGVPLTAVEERGLRAVLEEGKNEGLAVAVGECGLDYHYMALPREDQLALLKWHFGLARELDLPLILHQRDAEEDLRRLVEKEGVPARGAVLHCFGGSSAYYRWARERGCYVSFTGALTFGGKAKTPAPYFGELDLATTMVETDAPYMAPVPHRGGRNEPALLPLVARALAEKINRPGEDVAAETTLAARTLFGLPPDFGPGAVVYNFKDARYLNITNRCSNRCEFCLRDAAPGVGGHDLRLQMEPTAREVVELVGDPTRFNEVVFCGFGEPTARWETTKEIARAVKARGGRVRLDTNGSANLNAGRDVTPELAALFDRVSVSVNAGAAAEYARVCRPAAGERAWPALVAFIQGAKKYVPEVEVTAVALPGVELDGVRQLAAAWGVPLRVRPYVAPK